MKINSIYKYLTGAVGLGLFHTALCQVCGIAFSDPLYWPMFQLIIGAEVLYIAHKI